MPVTIRNYFGKEICLCKISSVGFRYGVCFFFKFLCLVSRSCEYREVQTSKKISPNFRVLKDKKIKCIITCFCTLPPIPNIPISVFIALLFFFLIIQLLWNQLFRLNEPFSSQFAEINPNYCEAKATTLFMSTSRVPTYKLQFGLRCKKDKNIYSRNMALFQVGILTLWYQGTRQRDARCMLGCNIWWPGLARNSFSKSYTHEIKKQQLPGTGSAHVRDMQCSY